MNSWTAADLWMGLALVAIVPAIWIESRFKMPEIAIAPFAGPIIGVTLARFGLQKNDLSHCPRAIKLPISLVLAIIDAAHSRIKEVTVDLHKRDCRRRFCHVVLSSADQSFHSFYN
jgi:hypothetical protein